ncbi:MAG: hypothetical protein CVU91_06285 [Firmicutes bacterium HGW-Firmicutes-16]|nr:MAG: hypothetical protein CVU91_06285 [Firmicutes bacterium HGW-Firmicutes-16]
MKTLTIIVAILALVLLACMLLCGLWLRAKGVTDAGSVAFHMQLGIATIVVSAISIILLLIRT